MAQYPQAMPMHPHGHPVHMGQPQMHAHGAGVHPHGPQMQMRAMPSYLGFELFPQTLPDGKRTWTGVRPQPMQKTEEQLAAIVRGQDKKDSQEDYQSPEMAGEKKKLVDSVIDVHQRMEMGTNYKWKLAYIKVGRKDLVSGALKFVVNRVTVTHIEFIIRKVLKKQVKAALGQSIPIPIPIPQAQAQAQMPFNQQNGAFQQGPIRPDLHGHHQGQYFGQQPQHQPQHHPQQHHPQQHHPQQHQQHNQHHHTGAPHGVTPLGRSSVAEVVSDYEDYDDDRSHNRRNRSRRDRSESPRIRIPDFSGRRSSKTSSQFTTRSYDSDYMSPLDSPATSVSSSPRRWPDERKRSSHHKKHHSRRDSGYSKRERRGSTGSNGSFVMVDKRSSRGRYGGSSGSYRSDDSSRGGSPSRRRNLEYREDHTTQALMNQLNQMKVDDLTDRVRQMEATVAYQEPSSRFDRPTLGRAYTDRPSIGYMSRPRRERYGSLGAF